MYQFRNTRKFWKVPINCTRVFERKTSIGEQKLRQIVNRFQQSTWQRLTYHKEVTLGSNITSQWLRSCSLTLHRLALHITSNWQARRQATAVNSAVAAIFASFDPVPKSAISGNDPRWIISKFNDQRSQETARSQSRLRAITLNTFEFNFKWKKAQQWLRE